MPQNTHVESVLAEEDRERELAGGPSTLSRAYEDPSIGPGG